MTGLAPAELSRLGRLVILVGPNGGGKTRSLQVVARMAGANQTSHLQESSDADRGITFLEYSHAETVNQAGNLRPSEFADQVRDARETVDLRQTHAALDVLMTHTARVLSSARHPDHATSADFDAEMIRAASFGRLIRALLDADLGFRLDASGTALPTLNGREFLAHQLSRGERVLLSWAHLLSQRAPSLSNSLLFLDEPELHLHPEACWRAISTLLDSVLGPHGQVWLATHSLPLVASACAEHGMGILHYVSNGKVEYAGNSVERVIGGLLGGEAQRESIHAFMGEADRLSVFQFASQCLVSPAPVGLRAAIHSHDSSWA